MEEKTPKFSLIFAESKTSPEITLNPGWRMRPRNQFIPTSPSLDIVGIARLHERKHGQAGRIS